MFGEHGATRLLRTHLVISQCTTAPIIKKTATTTHTEIIVTFSTKKRLMAIEKYFFFHYFAINTLLETKRIPLVGNLLTGTHE